MLEIFKELKKGRQEVYFNMLNIFIQELKFQRFWEFHVTLGRMTKIKKSIGSSGGWGSRERGTIRHCCWDWKLAQKLRRSVWRILTKLQCNLHGKAVTHLDKCPGLRVQTHSYFLKNLHCLRIHNSYRKERT